MRDSDAFEIPIGGVIYRVEDLAFDGITATVSAFHNGSAPHTERLRLSEATERARFAEAAGLDVTDLARVRETLLASLSVREDEPSKPATEPMPEAEPFPLDALPEPVRSLVADGAAALGVPVDFIGVPLLGIAAGVIGNTQRLQLKLGYEQRAILWLATVGAPGTGKSPALDVAREPMERLQRDARDAHTAAMERYEAELAAWERAEKSSRGEQPKPPRMRHLYVSDATLEALQAIHEHEPGLVLIRDELVGWVKSHDAYRKGGDRQSWLSAWAGSAVKIDRRTNGTAYIPEPCVSIVGGVQPDLLIDLAEESARHDGFLDRILWSYPDAPPMAWSDDTLGEHVTNDVKGAFEKLRNAPKPENPVRLSPEAKALFVAWHDDNAREIQRAAGLVQGIFSKLPNQLARLCLVLHCLMYPDNPAGVAVSAATMGAAIELVEYFAAHARRVLPRFGSVAEERAAGLRGRVLRVLRRAEGGWMNQSAIAVALGGHVPAAKLTEALEALEAEGVAERRTVPPGEKGGRPATQWRCVKTQEREIPRDDWGEL